MLVDNSYKNKLFLIIIFFFSAFTLFYNLGDRMLWGDEAETALLGLNINKYGLPKATDGKNYITLYGADIDTNEDDVWAWSPWLDEYIAAGSFSLFGKTTAAARLPFTLIAFISVVSFCFLVSRLFQNDELTIISTILYVTNIAFILHSRQCRYYPIISLSQIWLIYGYYLLLSERAKHGILFVTISLIVQFYSNYILVIPSLISLVLCTILIKKRYLDLLRNISVSLAIFILCIVPWLFYAKPWRQAGSIGSYNYWTQLGFYLSQIDIYIFPVVVLLLPAVVYFTGKEKFEGKSSSINIKDVNKFFWVLIPTTIFIICAFPGSFFRYLLPILPVLIILLSVVIFKYIKVRFLRILLVVVLSFSNTLSFSRFVWQIKNNINMPIIHHINSVFLHYENRLSDVVAFLKKYAQPGESVFVGDPEFPLIFYTDMHVINSLLNPKIFIKDLPDWILSENASGVFYTELDLPEDIKKYYDIVTLKVHDSVHGDSRPEPNMYMPYTANKFKDIAIYKKRKDKINQ